EDDQARLAISLKGEAGHRAKAAAAATAARPEQIRLLVRPGGDRMRQRVDELDRQEAVRGQAERPREQPVASAERMAGDADRRTASRRQRQPALRQELIDRAK